MNFEPRPHSKLLCYRSYTGGSRCQWQAGSERGLLLENVFQLLGLTALRNIVRKLRAHFILETNKREVASSADAISYPVSTRKVSYALGNKKLQHVSSFVIS